ncbi:unnamed protein product [Rhodiola kirilowii]
MASHPWRSSKPPVPLVFSSLAAAHVACKERRRGGCEEEAAG